MASSEAADFRKSVSDQGFAVNRSGKLGLEAAPCIPLFKRVPTELPTRNKAASLDWLSEREVDSAEVTGTSDDHQSRCRQQSSIRL